ncbi:MAG TPA: bacteriohemerythrin [Dongiaceae bacterium]|jgi:hemerythrin-like metal-binding protein|nr:bacteriohemerythrin [Dongiaceae bacterium]
MKVSAKITLLAVCPVAFAVTVSLTTLFVQQRRLHTEVNTSIRQQAYDQGAKVAQSVYWLCASSEARNQRVLAHNLGVARDLLTQSGGVTVGADTVSWQAVNQFTRQATAITLPKLLVGSNWLGQVTAAKAPAGFVDEVTHQTGDFCTIFQRMNDAGDMLRVSTTVLNTNDTRAIGTYIPAQNPDGVPNAVVQTVLKGETYCGRAFVVNQWQATAYEPIWDAAHKQVIGMLYTGIGMTAINKELHDAITEMVVGKTGYVYVLGGTGDQKGKYIVSFQGKRDGENIWEAKDASGRLFIQSVIEKGLKTDSKTVAFETYDWKNTGEATARTKFAAITYFKPWDWVIGAGAYEDDFTEISGRLTQAQRSMLIWVSVTAGAVALLAAVIGILVSRAIAGPIMRTIATLDDSSTQINSAAGQVSSASQALAEGASEQAASIEETSASLEELSSMTKRNSDNAHQANELAKQARIAADKGVADMQAMSTAMEAIKASSDDIAKIIKTIDEIAFQTNILALNAAVEAARAGEAGMGFAVVADEVRNLAQRSAQAARETATKIEGAITRTTQGVEINAKVAEALNEIVTKARQVDELAAEVASASREQTQGIAQINMAVGQMDKVTQGNAANAEETAAAAEQLNAQAEVMKQSVVELEVLIQGGCRTGRTTSHEAPAGHYAATDFGAAAVTPAPVSRGNRPPQAIPSAEVTHRISWNPTTMATGVESIDEQHQELIEMVNNLDQACRQGEAQQHLQEMVEFLVDYTQRHFRHEEGLMEHSRCPNAGKNKQAHQKLLAGVGKFQERLQREGASISLVLELKKFVGSWLTSHICKIDTGLRQCNQACQRPAASKN